MPIFSRLWTHPQTGTSDPDRLQLSGPALYVEISFPSTLEKHYLEHKIALPSSRSGYALIDTGASITAVDVDALTNLGLNPIGTVNVLTPSGEGIQSLFACRISFPETPIPPLDFNFVTGSQLSRQGYIALIGRDLLRHFQLVYNGVDGFWTLAF